MKTALNYLRRYGKILAIAAIVVLIGYLPAQAIRLVPDVIEGKGEHTYVIDTDSIIVTEAGKRDTSKAYTARRITNWGNSDKNVWPDSVKYIITFNSGDAVADDDSCIFIITPLIGYKTSNTNTVWTRSTTTSDTIRQKHTSGALFHEWNFAWDGIVPPGMAAGGESVYIKFEYTGGGGENGDTTRVLTEHLIPYVNEY